MIWKLICPNCVMEMRYESANVETTTHTSTIKQKYKCPRCKKVVEVWFI